MRIVNVCCVIIVISLATLSSEAVAQGFYVQGKIQDEKNSPLSGVNVRLVNLADSSETYHTDTNPDGIFSFSKIPPKKYRLDATSVGRQKISDTVQVRGDLNLDVLMMTVLPVPMNEVLVQGRVPVALQNGDTTEFRAGAVKVNRDATAEDLLTKLPGITVNNGTITAGGETVQRVLVDGKPFFGDDPTLTVRNLPAEVIDKIQVFDQASDQAQFTGFDDGQSLKALNIITRRDRGNLHFGKATAGYGENDRYEAGGNLNMFDGDRRISLVGLSNNIN
ncbi:MAG TPA: carboxypeptidase regulatory-like domain-containing protein, partial [Bacteroidota bacterium]|nr:carboxypeptidase regulatory-like domain-containing protein [Bacteroidota bacterium]